MRKIPIFLCVVFLLVSMVFPAFALGNGDGDMLYSPIQWTEIYSDLEGGGFELPFNYVNEGSGYTYFSAGATSTNVISVYHGRVWTSSNGGAYGEITFSGDNYTFVARQQVVDVERCDDYLIGLMTDARFKNVRAYGTYYVLQHYSNGSYGLQKRNFTYTLQYGSTIATVFSLGRLLSDALPAEAYEDSYVFFDTLNIDLSVERNTVDTTIINFSAAPGVFQSYVIPETFYINSALSDIVVLPDDGSSFELGTFLSDTVMGFLNTEIVPGFSFNTLIYLVVVIGLLLWFITMII